MVRQMACFVALCGVLAAQPVPEQAQQVTASLERVLVRLHADSALRPVLVEQGSEAAAESGRLLVPLAAVRAAHDDDELAGMLAHGLEHATGAAVEREQAADAAAVARLAAAGIDPMGLLRYLERTGADAARLAALRTKLAAFTAAPAAPLTSECEVIQALLDELSGKKPAPR